MIIFKILEMISSKIEILFIAFLLLIIAESTSQTMEVFTSFDRTGQVLIIWEPYENVNSYNVYRTASNNNIKIKIASALPIKDCNKFKQHIPEGSDLWNRRAS